MIFGAVMATPAIGPANVGLSGFALLESWQALNATAIATTLATLEILCDIKNTHKQESTARGLSAARRHAQRGAFLTIG
jgi:hypothetical protein